MDKLVYSIGPAPSEREFGAVIDMCRAERSRVNELLSRRPVKKEQVKKAKLPRKQRAKKMTVSNDVLETAAQLMGITVEELKRRTSKGA